MNSLGLFYVSASIALLASFCVITQKNAVHALLYLIVSLLALALCFYLLGAPFAAALQIIVYAGAIMVLFVFAVMMFNINQQDIERESQWLSWQSWLGPSLLVTVLLVEVLFILQSQPAWTSTESQVTLIDAKAVGSLLFGPYLLAVEIASFLLLAGLVGGYHLAKALPHKPVNKEVNQP
ncbi:NADH-quinone oxidoreductase subunit J [Paraglaciecola polaris]|uniref:NADH-quinone oxidoreductase subunit J n=1 Tax=Paraglaciecola polaris LMG 21857 TaxID=1129793 RepID=K7AH70_9ALTE|nr:NADH-quinone oxidoreductase subunit J [Paraglaciecola polaris]GAC34610.1 NADH-quinone oxidoreductase subunit J [Paraglaciecola polaris LMG 21857]